MRLLLPDHAGILFWIIPVHGKCPARSYSGGIVTTTVLAGGMT